jgi:hypothetical protein
VQNRIIIVMCMSFTFKREAKWVAFHEQAAPHERIHAARLNVIKEVCGNAAVSLACGLVFAVGGAWLRGIAFLYPCCHSW